MTQKHVSAQKSAKQAAEQQEERPTDLRDESLGNDVDSMLDEIDGVLETNASEFVSNYIQKGGQ